MQFWILNVCQGPSIQNNNIKNTVPDSLFVKSLSVHNGMVWKCQILCTLLVRKEGFACTSTTTIWVGLALLIIYQRYTSLLTRYFSANNIIISWLMIANEFNIKAWLKVSQVSCMLLYIYWMDYLVELGNLL